MKQVLPLDDADLTRHLLCMCPAKWQTLYDLTEKMTPVNTRALLLILEKIKNNAEVETEPSSAIKPKGAEGKRKMEYINSCIPKKSKQVVFSDKHCTLCKKHGGPHKSMTVVSIILTVLLSTGMGAQEAHKGTGMLIRTIQIRENVKKQILLRKAFCKHSHKHKKRRANNSESDSDSDYSS
jgi:hypothetical protein